MSSFGSISTAMTALQAHRRALDVTGHNIANVNTPGYTRQRVDLEPRHAAGSSSLLYNQRLAGAGVEVVGTSRLGDEFLTARVRSQTSLHADLQARAETLTEVERLLSEPGDTGLSKQLSEMWNAWSNLGNNPDTLAAKTVLVNKTQAVVDSLKTGHGQVATLWENQRGQAASLTTEVNTLTGQIADLNEAVLAATKDGAANELLDQRDQLVTRLVELTGATAVPAKDGMVNVYLAGNPAVAGIHSYQVELTGGLEMDSAGAIGLRWAGASGQAINLSGGQLLGTVASLNETLPGAATKYDQIAVSLRDAVNGPYGPGDFLTGSDAGSLSLVAAIDPKQPGGDPKNIQASADPVGQPKDGSIALAIGKLRGAPGGPDALWQQHVVATGVAVQAATARAEVVQQTLTTAVADQQSAVAVSLDEETANLLVIQRAYEGAARVLTAVDEALDVLINRTGLVGR